MPAVWVQALDPPNYAGKSLITNKVATIFPARLWLPASPYLPHPCGRTLFESISCTR